MTAVIIVRVLAGLTAVISGAAAMLAPKRAGRHPRRGTLYCGALVVVAITATVGYTARRVRWRGWLRHHITGMAVSYIVLLTAFYVDNGPTLPVWNLLPPATFWVLPAAIGLPLLHRALRRHTSPARRHTTPTQETST